MLNEVRPNEVHQADLLYLQHEKVGCKTYKYSLTIVDVASRNKEAEALTDKSSTEVAAALTRIYQRGPLTWQNLINSNRPWARIRGSIYKITYKAQYKNSSW